MWQSRKRGLKVTMGLGTLGFQFGHIDFHPNHPWAQIMWTYRVAPCNSQTFSITLEFSFSAVQVKQKGMRNSKESKKNCWETKVPTWPRWLRLDFRCHQDSLWPLRRLWRDASGTFLGKIGNHWPSLTTPATLRKLPQAGPFAACATVSNWVELCAGVLSLCGLGVISRRPQRAGAEIAADLRVARGKFGHHPLAHHFLPLQPDQLEIKLWHVSAL